MLMSSTAVLFANVFLLSLIASVELQRTRKLTASVLLKALSNVDADEIIGWSRGFGEGNVPKNLSRFRRSVETDEEKENDERNFKNIINVFVVRGSRGRNVKNWKTTNVFELFDTKLDREAGQRENRTNEEGIDVGNADEEATAERIGRESIDEGDNEQRPPAADAADAEQQN
jgi:hypothetical protein